LTAKTALRKEKSRGLGTLCQSKYKMFYQISSELTIRTILSLQTSLVYAYPSTFAWVDVTADLQSCVSHLKLCNAIQYQKNT